MVDDDVPERADGVVETAAVVDAEVLGHRHLHGPHVLAIPDPAEHPVREAQVEELVEAELAQEMVDAVELLFLDDAVQFPRQLFCRREVVAERLLDDDPCVVRQPGAAEAGDDDVEEERRHLQVEDRPPLALQDLFQAVVGRRIGEVAGDV